MLCRETQRESLSGIHPPCKYTVCCATSPVEFRPTYAVVLLKLVSVLRYQGGSIDYKVNNNPPPQATHRLL